jgi:hypothetical protein
MRKISRLLAAVALVGAGLIGTADASTISVQPGAQTIGVGGVAVFDVVVGGLAANETVGGYSFLLTWNPAIIGAGASITIDPDSKMGVYDSNNDFSNFGGFATGTIDLFYLANLATFPTEAGLKASEGAGFRLAHFSFTGLAEGLTPLTLSVSPQTGVFFSNFDGTGIIPANAVNGSVCVNNAGGPCTTAAVPEPATLSLLGTGIAAFVARRRRQVRTKA